MENIAGSGWYGFRTYDDYDYEFQNLSTDVKLMKATYPNEHVFAFYILKDLPNKPFVGDAHSSPMFA